MVRRFRSRNGSHNVTTMDVDGMDLVSNRSSCAGRLLRAYRTTCSRKRPGCVPFQERRGIDGECGLMLTAAVGKRVRQRGFCGGVCAKFKDGVTMASMMWMVKGLPQIVRNSFLTAPASGGDCEVRTEVRRSPRSPTSVSDGTASTPPGPVFLRVVWR